VWLSILLYHLNAAANTNCYTEKKYLKEAHIIVTCLNNPDGKKSNLKQGGEDINYKIVLGIDQPIAYFFKIK